MGKLKVIIIDNRDSFTYNLVDSLRKIGNCEIDVFPEHVSTRALENCDKIILSPGPGLPSDFPGMLSLIEKFVNKKPILGICLGHQAIAEFSGATLKQLKPVVHGQQRKVLIRDKTSIFSGFPDEISVCLYHSWLVDANNFPAELDVIASDTLGQIMGLKLKNRPVFGTQFHPESFASEFGLQLLKNFLELA